jgi:large subunit ribosomal protein L9
MDIILLQKVDNLGDLGDTVHVKRGYGRNYLIPSGRAVPATPENLEAFEARRAELQKEAAAKMAEAERRKEVLDGMAISITCKAGEDGRLFGSVGTADIAKVVSDTGVELAKKEVILPNGAFRVAGEYEVDLHLHADVNATLRLSIIPEA